MDEYLIRWTTNSIHDGSLDEPVIVEADDEECAVLKGTFIIMEKMVKKNSRISCESCMMQDEMIIKAYKNDVVPREIGEIRGISAEKIWMV